MKTLRDLGEFGLIGRIAQGLARHEDILTGAGDDCAVVRAGDRQFLLTSDACVQDVHFRRGNAAPEDIGWKAAAAAISDIAAMGGTPRFLLVTLACAEDTEIAFIDGVYSGLNAAAAEAGAAIVGGDVSRATTGVLVDVAVLGEVTEGRCVPRGGAREGDLLAVTGHPGRSAAGLVGLELNKPDPALTRVHQHPVPRLAAGRWLARAADVHAMIDVSDGLVQDTAHLAKMSGLCADIDPVRLPIAPELAACAKALGLPPEQFVLTGGEDYELAVAIAPANADALCARFEEACGLPLTVVGVFKAGTPGVHVAGEAPGSGGFDHFTR